MFPDEIYKVEARQEMKGHRKLVKSRYAEFQPGSNFHIPFVF